MLESLGGQVSAFDKCMLIKLPAALKLVMDVMVERPSKCFICIRIANFHCVR